MPITHWQNSLSHWDSSSCCCMVLFVEPSIHWQPLPLSSQAYNGRPYRAVRDHDSYTPHYHLADRALSYIHDYTRVPTRPTCTQMRLAGDIFTPRLTKGNDWSHPSSMFVAPTLHKLHKLLPRILWTLIFSRVYIFVKSWNGQVRVY